MTHVPRGKQAAAGNCSCCLAHHHAVHQHCIARLQVSQGEFVLGGNIVHNVDGVRAKLHRTAGRKRRQRNQNIIARIELKNVGLHGLGRAEPSAPPAKHTTAHCRQSGHSAIIGVSLH